MSTIIESIDKEQLRRAPRFDAGDRVRVHFQVIEGTRRRTQVFEGVVIKRQGSGARETFTVRKQSFGVGVERTFPLHSPKIEALEVAARGDVRRAKLYYLRDRVGKAARVAERRWGITDDVFDVAEGPVDSEGTAQAEADVEVTEVEEDEEGAAATAAEGDELAATGAEGGDDEPAAEPAADATEEVATEQAGAESSAEAEGGSEPSAETEAGAEATPEADAAAGEESDAGSASGEDAEAPAEDEASQRDG